MKRLNDITLDGYLYENTRLNIVESLVPSNFESNHACDLLELPNGDLLCAWFAGSDEGNSDVRIVLSRLNKDTEQWSKPAYVSDDNGYSEQNPSLFQKDNEEIWLIYTAQKPRVTDAKFNLQYTAKIYIKRSKDNGYTWTDSEVLFDREGSFCRQKIQKLSNGRWIFSNWLCFNDDTQNGSDISIIYVSDNEGQSWVEKEIPNSQGRVHCNIIEIAKGKLIGLMRSRAADNIYITRSFDNGETWTEPVRTELPNNNSGISAIKLESGNLAIVYNELRFNDKKDIAIWPFERVPVTIAISKDNGNSWTNRRHIEFGEGYVGLDNRIKNRRYEYPCVMQSEDQSLHVAYSYGDRKTIKYVQIDEKWVLG